MSGVYDALGIAEGYHDIGGEWHPTPAATRRRIEAAMGTPEPGEPMWFVPVGATPDLRSPCALTLESGIELDGLTSLPPDMPIGYHLLRPLDGGPLTHLVVHPPTCPAAPPAWGVAAQVYSMWGEHSWGVGDLRDVAALADAVGARGGGVVLLSPLHAPAPTLPQEPSPYYPSSRRWLNPLLLPMAGPPPASVDNTPGGRIDRDAAWTAKRAALEHRFATTRGSAEWRAWAREQGADLWTYCRWSALADGFGTEWTEWPVEYRHPSSPAVLDLPLVDPAFAERCEFHAWCQWLVHREVAQVAAAARVAGVGLVGDLAVGSRADGADGWALQDVLALDMRIGAPPDGFNADGQEWGLPPFVPWRLRAAQYLPFRAMLRSALAGMAGLRIDHVMGLFRQFWVPVGSPPAEGGYVGLPAHELLAIIAIEAHRAGAFVVGEDLGTVPPEVLEGMKAFGVLGTKVWWFDTEVDDWPADALATVTTHDLPTVAGVWAGADGTPEHRAALRALVAAGGTAADAAAAVHAAVGSSPSVLRLATLDDLAGAVHRPNLPGDWGEDSWSWNRRLTTSPADILATPLATSILHPLASVTRRP
jgi:4-alpha-glucanotransferase